MRFTHLEGSSYTPDSLSTYKSRVKSALEDFANYIANPMAFRPGVSTKKVKARPLKLRPKNDVDSGNRATPSEVAGPSVVSVSSFSAANILPIPLRADLVVRIEGIPYDLTPAEAKKIANVVLAMAHAAPP